MRKIRKIREDRENRELLFLLGILLAAILQGTLLNAFRFFWVKPDLLLSSVVIASLTLRPRWALISSCLAGFLKDSLGVYLFGMNTLFFPLWSLLIIRLKKEITVESHQLIPPAILVILCILNNLVIRIIFLFLGGLTLPAGILIRTIVIEAAYTGLLFPLLLEAVKPVVFSPAYKK